MGLLDPLLGAFERRADANPAPCVQTRTRRGTPPRSPTLGRAARHGCGTLSVVTAWLCEKPIPRRYDPGDPASSRSPPPRNPPGDPRAPLLRGCLALAALLIGAPALADAVPQIGTWNHYRFTTDPRPVTVRLTHPSGRTFPLLTVPRSYIYYAPDAPTTDKGPLPDAIATSTLGLAFVGPDGEPWPVAVNRVARERGVSIEEAGRLLRDQLYRVKVRASTKPDERKFNADLAPRMGTEVEPLDGLRRFRVGGRSDYFLGDVTDDFTLVTCIGTSSRGTLCAHGLVVAEGLRAEASFIDLRVHGSRSIANERTRLAREVVCRFTDAC